MKFSNIISGVKNYAGRAACKVKAHSPEILLVVGVGGLIGGTVLACRATLKAHTIKEEMDVSLKEIHDCEADEGLKDQYTEEDAVNDKVHVFTKAAVKLTGLYAPSVLLCGCSIACILLSHRIMSDRTAAAIAFGNTATAALAEYRTQIAEKYGKEAEEAIHYSVKTEKVTVPEDYANTDGSGKPIESEVKCLEMTDSSRYAVLIDDKCEIWDRNSDLTLMSIHSACRYLNDKLVARSTATKPGYLFLREAYDYLGVPREQWPKEANLVGWLYDKNNPDLENYIDFGPLYLLSMNEAGSGQYYIRDDGGNADRRAVLVDFNIDGMIYDKI